VADKIKVLPESLTNKIAAGEVVERPASVVKELVENSLDAGADKIEVEVLRAGRRLIRVSDNGEGMSRNDAIAAFDRHATSKISKPSDLNSIQSFGFRGEALPSIAAVSRVTLVTQQSGELEGTRVVIHGGVLKKVEAAGRSPGTTITVEHLFFNTPARRRFLKSDDTEFNWILRVFNSQAMVMPDVSFHLVHNNAKVVSFPPCNSWEERIIQVLGRNIFNSLRPVRVDYNSLKLEGFISPPDVYRGRHWPYYFFVNQRPVNSPLLTGVLSSIFTDILPRGARPIAVLHLVIDPREVDVNVHPAKLEVRFIDRRKVSLLVKTAIEKAISGAPSRAHLQEIESGISRPDQEDYSKPETSLHLYPGGGQAVLGLSSREAPNVDPNYGPQEAGTMSQGVVKEDIAYAEIDSGRLIWQLHKSFIFVQVKSGLVIIDQHAAHERILYEETLNILKHRNPISQRLLFPELLELSIDEYRVFKKYQKLLNDIGFSFREFSERSLVIEAIPAMIKVWDNGKVLFRIINELSSENLPQLRFEEKFASAFACHSAIKLGDELTAAEMFSLFDRLFATSSPYFCPHGRPTVIQIGLDDLYRRFNRK